MSVPAIPAAGRARFDLTRALDGLRGRKRVLVYMHDNPDPDSLASAMGLARLLEQELGLEAVIGTGGIIGRAENRAMIEELGVQLVPLDQLDLASFDTRAIVDSQPGTGNNSLPLGGPIDIIVDHHPRRDGSRATWCDIRPELGATTTIVLQYLRERALPLGQELATAMFYAIKTETRDLGREASEAERSAYLHLVSLVDHDRLYRICHPKVSREHFKAVDRALRSALCWDDVVAANLGELSYPDLVAEIADMLLSLDGARFALCVGRYRNKVFLSLRTDVDFSNAGSVMRHIVASDGSAGGHGTMAGGSLQEVVTTAARTEAWFRTLVERLHSALGKAPGPEVSLLPDAKPDA